MKKNIGKAIKVSVDIVISKSSNVIFFDQRFLFGKLSKKWDPQKKGIYGFLGREIKFGEKIRSAVKRIAKEDLNCKVTWQRIFCVNTNYSYGNHYVVFGVYATISGTIKNLKPEDWIGWEWHRKYSEEHSKLFPSAEKTWNSAFNGKPLVCYSE